MTSTRDRLLELLTDRALVGLGAREQIELAELMVQAQDIDITAFDAAAAAVALAAIGTPEPMPAALAKSIEERALASMSGAHPTNLADGRPASDYAATRELDGLAPGAPGYAQTQVDVMVPVPIEPLVTANQGGQGSQGTQGTQGRFKQTRLMDERPDLVAVPDSRPTLTRPNDPYARSAPSAPAPVSGPHAPISVPHAHAPAYASPRPPQPSGNVVPFPSAPRAPSRILAVSGWLAAAACLLLAIGALRWRSKIDPVATLPAPTTPATGTELGGTSGTPPALPASAAAVAQTPAALREQLLAAAGTIRSEWSATKDPAGRAATGEVVWNKDQQKGVMRFRGLAKNDPSRTQYQLWIFDKTRDDKYPVDGGVFDVDSETGDVIVPIHAAVAVNTPSLFAVTVEKPGGVVVSKRERIVVTAKPAG